MKHYTITIEPPERANAPHWSAYCKEWGFTTENKTPEEALSSLFDAIHIAEKDQKRTFLPGAKATTFTVPYFS